MDRIDRSFRLVAQSYRLLMKDKELMILPVLSGILIASVCVSFFFGFDLTAFAREHAGNRMSAQFAWPIFVFYLVTYAIGIFFQAAIVAGATERMRGGNPTLGSALAAAGRRIVAILFWSLIAATVGMALQGLRDKSNFLGKLVVGLLGAAWSLATFFIVPVLVLEDLSVSESFWASVEAFKKTWGETFVGSAGLGLASFLAWLVLGAVVALLVMADAVAAAIAVGVGFGILIVIFFTTLHGVYVASLYRYATAGEVPAGFDKDLLREAFVPKDR